MAAVKQVVSAPRNTGHGTTKPSTLTQQVKRYASLAPSGKRVR